MNPDTHFLIDRPYREIVEDILTAMTGGVVNEPVIFDVKSDLYPLAQPALDLRRITGLVIRNGGDPERYTFQKGIDYLFSEGDNAVVWEEGGSKPRDETTFYVDYFLKNSRSPISDINVGSVTRTVSEAVGREIATVYEQINIAYRAGFLDTAEGKALDLVVSILGVVRKSKDFAVGLTTFFRDPTLTGNITIPQGTRLTTGKGEALFETTEPRTLQRGQIRIEVPIRAGEAFKGEAGRTDTDTITQMSQPIAGIDRVTNLEPTILSAENETDDQLRDRARAVLRSLGKATIAALSRAVFESRAKLLEVRDPNSPPLKRTEPGAVTLLVETEPEKMPSLAAAVHQTRAAGVLATLVARYIFFKPRLVVTISAGLTGPGKDKLVGEIIAAIGAYADGLSSGDAAVGAEILKTIESVADVAKGKTRIVDVLVWQTDTAEPGTASLVDTLMDQIKNAPADDEPALRERLLKTLNEQGTPQSSGRRTPNRDLLKGPTGARAGDEDLESAQFSVIAKIDGKDWWVVPDMEPADILLVEGS